MAIGLRASGSVTYDANAASQTVTKPAGTATGDVAIMAVGINFTTVATPTGWTLVGSIVLTNATTFVFSRVIQAGDTTWTLTPGGGAQQFGVAFQTFTGVDNTTPIDATGTANSSASGTTIATNAVTIATDQAWHLIGVGTFNGGGSATGFTALTNGASPANEGAALLYNQTPKSVGSTGTVTVTTTTGAKSAVPFALRPAAGAAAGYVPPPFPGIAPAIQAV